MAPSCIANIAPQTACPLLRLPPELRLRIYELVVGADTGVKIKVRENVWVKKGNKYLYGMPLLITCKYIRSDAHDTVWNNVRFSIHLTPASLEAFERDQSWWTHLDTVQRCSMLRDMRKVHIVVDP